MTLRITLGIVIVMAACIGSSFGQVADTGRSRVKTSEAPASVPVSAADAVQYRKERRIVIPSYNMGEDGIFVEDVDPTSTTSTMRSADDNTKTAALKPGDTITELDGKPLVTLPDYYAAMRNAKESILATIIDAETGTTAKWKIDTIAVDVPDIADHADAAQGSKVHLVYTGLTLDGTIGDYIALNGPDIDTLVSMIDESRRGKIVRLTGSDCTAAKILAAIDGLEVAPVDTLFFYYQGHGAYDPSKAADDPALGHFFAIPGGDLMRRKLIHQILMKKPRLALVVSDCCNVEARASAPAQYTFPIKAAVPVWSGMQSLLFSHRGIIDVTASSRGQYAWYSTGDGGWFTYAFTDRLRSTNDNPKSNWNVVWPNIVTSTEGFYQSQRGKLNSPDLAKQLHMRPMAFLFDVRREDPADLPQPGP